MNHRPLRVQFVLTSLPVGGAETLLLNMVRTMDRVNFAPEVTCLKQPGELGPSIEAVVPLHSNLLSGKWDIRVLGRLIKLFRAREADAVVTIGAGDKMFWGRLAAKLAGVPVICSALHSTGWPDGVGKLNRLLTSITSGFIAVAKEHAKFMVEWEKFPANRVFMIPNGVDTNRFQPNSHATDWLRAELKVPPNTKLVGIVAALRHEKNHLQFVEAAGKLIQAGNDAHFVIVGDGPERASIESAIKQAGLVNRFHLLGSRSDTQRIVAALDVFCLTSRNEANPVSILEALACEVPVVSPNVGSISETVIPGQTGYLTQPLSAIDTSDRIQQLLNDPQFAKQLGRNGRAMVESSWSLQAMVEGYQSLIEQLYNQAAATRGLPTWIRQAPQSDSLSTEQDESTSPMLPILACESGMLSTSTFASNS